MAWINVIIISIVMITITIVFNKVLDPLFVQYSIVCLLDCCCVQIAIIVILYTYIFVRYLGDTILIDILS